MKILASLRACAALVALPCVSAITYEQMLAAPRRGAAVPNADGTLAVFSATNYSFETHESSTTWNMINLTSGDISTIFEGSTISEIVWVGSEPTSVIYVNGTNEEDDGGISIYSADITSLESGALIASLPAPYSGFKAVQTNSGDINFIAYCPAYPNGTAYNEALAEEALSSARIYSSIYVRHWDTWLTPQKNALFGGTLRGDGGSFSFDGNLTNYVTGIENVTAAECPVMPYGGTDHYDLSPDGSQVVWMTKNVDLPLANYTSTIIYLVPFSGSASDAVPINAWTGPSTPPKARGATAYPTFSPDGTHIAYFQMDGVSYESDRNKLYVAAANADSPNITVLAENWDRSPNVLIWAGESDVVYAAAPDLGQERIFPVPLNASADYAPKNITDQGVPAGMSLLANGNILVSDSKIWSSRDMYIVSPEGEVVSVLLRAYEIDPELAGLGPDDVSEFYSEGAFTDIQSFVVYPTDFDESKTYPLAFLVHGGPQGAWFNSWSTRWNPKVWADQGYVAVLPNPTASSGWGQNLTDAIQNNWGNYPYTDLVGAWEYVNSTFDYVDTVNGIAAGASYGGYMMNWIQGHDLGRKFKALVTHDGVTSTLDQYASEELWFVQREFNGTLWDARDNYERWNPIDHISNWATPHFVVHNSLDYRLPESEGIMLFNILQELGVPSKLLSFPDENHWVLKRENSAVWHNEIFKWINYWSGVSGAASPY